ncbi:hypothetical protein [Clostridium acidisoli]|uniref:hypothetical protein n=1 Tax=Clostridium acidisoli TaxID=91624 RepID=UPI000A00569C|nr:hypothetical protein [Clostridium acidisoli]
MTVFLSFKAKLYGLFYWFGTIIGTTRLKLDFKHKKKLQLAALLNYNINLVIGSRLVVLIPYFILNKKYR